MKKLIPLPRLKRKAWKTFSLWVRNRGADRDGYNHCVTCDFEFPIKELNAGHFIHGHTKATFMVEENVHPQCVKCNHFLSGNLLEYTEFMRKKYGQDTIDHLRELRHQIWKPSRTDLEAIIEKYKL